MMLWLRTIKVRYNGVLYSFKNEQEKREWWQTLLG